MPSLTLSNLRSRIRLYIGDTSSDTTKQRFTDAIIDDALNDMVNELAHDGLLKKDSGTDVVVAGDNAYTFPTDAFKVYRMTRAGKVMYGVSQTDLDEIKRDWENDDAGEPAYWYPTTARNFKFYPKAGSGFANETITHYFFDIPALLTSTTDTPDFADEFHVAPAYGAAAVLLQMDRRSDEAAPYQGRFTQFKLKAVKALRRMEDRAKDHRMSIDLELSQNRRLNPVDQMFKSGD